jgi:hypothetical protein
VIISFVPSPSRGGIGWGWVCLTIFTRHPASFKGNELSFSP